MLSKNQIKEIQSLHLKKQRDIRKLFIVEGVKSVMEVLANKAELVIMIFATGDFLLNNSEQINRLKINYTKVSTEELEKISLQSNPNQVLALCNYFNVTETTFDFKNNWRYLNHNLFELHNIISCGLNGKQC